MVILEETRVDFFSQPEPVSVKFFVILRIILTGDASPPFTGPEGLF
jgi:hypothetical protein